MSCKLIVFAICLAYLLIATVDSSPVPDRAKIRIHVPVKHHTHLHTKTIVKTVHVGIPVKKAHGEEEHGWEYGKKKKGSSASSYLSLL